MHISCIITAYLHKITSLMQFSQASKGGEKRNKMSDKTSKNLWGGRFTGEANPKFAEFNRSFGFDRRLFEGDVRGSLAHCKGLAGAGVLSSDEAAQIKSALHKILENGRADSQYLEDAAVEDVHSFVEAR